MGAEDQNYISELDQSSFKEVYNRGISPVTFTRAF